MPDAWTLDTPAGPYALNPTFSAPKYQPGSVSGPGALRRDDRATYQRSGDGLPTPGTLTLIGHVWRDDHDAAQTLHELEAIRGAVATCTSVTRANGAGRYVYDGLAGGARLEAVPDGLNGWSVTLELWPGRATPTFFPSALPQVRLISFGESSGGSLTISTGIVAGDYVALLYHRSNASAANEALPAWLDLLDASSGSSAVGPQHVAIYAGVAPASITSITVPESTFARGMLIAVQDAHANGIQRTSIVGPSASPLPGLEVPGGSLLLLLQSRWYSDLWGSPRPGESIASRREGTNWATDIDARAVSGDATGPIGRTPSIAGSYAAGMAIALPLQG